MATNSYYKYLLTFSLGGILFTACAEKAAEETPKKEPKIAQENTKQTDKKDDSESKTSDLASTDKNEEKEKRVIFIPPVVQEPDPLPEPYPYPRDPEPEPEPYGFQEPPVPPAEKKRQEEEILIVVEEPAEFPGGMAEMRVYLAKNIVYPTTAMELAIEGKVYLRFNVMIDGSINSVKVLKGITDCPECDKEAVRVVKAMPKWKPAKNIGKAVNSQMTIPVIFKLQ